MNWEQIAAACEQATGPDTRLDAEIVATMNHALLKPYPPQTDFGPGQRWQFWSLDGLHFLGNEAKHPFKVLPVTGSVDAALSLVSERLTWMLQTRFNGYHAEVGWPGTADAATPALALCAAAARTKGAPK